MPTRLVSILGLGNPSMEGVGYVPVVYGFGGRRAAKTALVARAHCELFAPVDSVVLLGTPEVRERRLDTGAVSEALGRPWHFVEVPKGQDEAERWQLFSRIRLAMNLEPLAEAGETSAPDRILFDVTHGFRTQPLFAMAVLSYMQSEWARMGPDVVRPEVRVLYGAYDPQNPPPPGEPAAVWDLTQQLTVTRWNLALDALQRYGRADDLAALAEETTKRAKADARARGEAGEALRAYGNAQRLGVAAKSFADDLAFARFRDLIAARFARQGGKAAQGSAVALLDYLESDDAGRLVDELPVLRDGVARLAEWVRPLVAGSLASPEGVRALGSLAMLYERLQRFSEQAVAIREGTVLVHGVQTGRAVEPGLPHFEDAHDVLEKELQAIGYRLQRKRAPATVAFALHGLPPSETHRRAVEVFGTIGKPRNDIEHGGLNKQPLDAKSLWSDLVKRREDFEALVAGVTAGEPPAPRDGFVNLSNHPIITWSSAQREAAAALEHGAPVEIEGGMPTVLPSASAKDVAVLVDDIVARVLAMRCAGAHVATEFTLAVGLVAALRRAGVRCYAATTERSSTTTERAGVTVKESVFRFVQWREYP
jgi:CRISPR-associated DxTHG motif protein